VGAGSAASSFGESSGAEGDQGSTELKTAEGGRSEWPLVVPKPLSISSNSSQMYLIRDIERGKKIQKKARHNRGKRTTGFQGPKGKKEGGTGVRLGKLTILTSFLYFYLRS